MGNNESSYSGLINLTNLIDVILNKFITNAFTGLILSLDNLLSTTPPAKISECTYSPTPTKKTDIRVSYQSPQLTTASEYVQTKPPATSRTGGQPIPLPDSSHQDQVSTDRTDHSESEIDKSISDSSVLKSVTHVPSVQVSLPDAADTYDRTVTLPDSSQQGFPSSRDPSTLMPTQNVQSTKTGTAAIPSTPTDEPHQVMLRYNDKLVMALSADPLGIAIILLAKGLIPENTAAQMQSCSTPHEKACILVTVIRERVGVAPKRFQDFVQVLSEQTWTKDIMEILQPFINTELKENPASMHISRAHDHKSLNPEPSENISSSEQSSSSEDNAFPILNSEDEAELEAQLIMSAESMKKKFAALLWDIIDSFNGQDIDVKSLVTGILALTEYEDSSVGKPLLEHEKDSLMKAKDIDQIFHILRPHMSFFNYETLEFLVDKKGSKEDKRRIQKYLREFKHFCKRSVFEVPQSMLHQSTEKALKQQVLHVKVTKQFRAAILIDGKEQSASTASCELGISLEAAKHIQRKIASVLKVTVSSLYLDFVSTGSTILTFLLPSNISLAYLDTEPEVIALSSNGIHFLCGPPGKPKPKELTSNGLVVQWTQPEYGRLSLAKYILHYLKKPSDSSPSEWQKLELSSQNVQACVPDLSDGDTYVLKVCTVSDVGTLQFSDESDPIIISADGISTDTIFIANDFSYGDPSTVTHQLSSKGLTSLENEAQIGLTSTPSKTVLLRCDECNKPLTPGQHSAVSVDI